MCLTWGGADPVSRDGEGRSYAACAISRGRPSRRRRGCGGVLSAGLTTTVPVDWRANQVGSAGVHMRVAGSTGERGTWLDVREKLITCIYNLYSYPN